MCHPRGPSLCLRKHAKPAKGCSSDTKERCWHVLAVDPRFPQSHHGHIAGTPFNLRCIALAHLLQ